MFTYLQTRSDESVMYRIIFCIYFKIMKSVHNLIIVNIGGIY